MHHPEQDAGSRVVRYRLAFVHYRPCLCPCARGSVINSEPNRQVQVDRLNDLGLVDVINERSVSVGSSIS